MVSSRWYRGLSLFAVSMILGGCVGIGGDSEPTPTQRGLSDLSDKSPEYRMGANDGCRTAEGNYTKSHDAFSASEEYRNGWYAGRSACNSI
jgi:hypothetical protein